MHSQFPPSAYLFALAVVLRAALGLFAQALRRPGGPLALNRNGRVLLR